MAEKTDFELNIVWEEIDVVDSDRIDAMYCFKNCSVNQN